MSKVDEVFSRLRQRRKNRTPLETLRSTILVDPIWYRESHLDLRGTSIDAPKHYLDYGAREGRNPHPLFDTNWYLSRTPDAASSGVNPLVHYLASESFARSHPHPLFDVDFYMVEAFDFNSSRLDPLTHYLTIGWKQGVHPSKFFDPAWYLEKYPDVRSAGIEPLSHYVQWGWRENRKPNPSFDPIAYRERNHLPRNINPLVHSIIFAEKTSTQEAFANPNDGELTANMSPLPREVDGVAAQQTHISVASGAAREPSIRPPTPVAAVDHGRHARDLEIVSAVRALYLEKTEQNTAPAQFPAQESELKIIAAKLALAAADSPLPTDAVSAAIRQSANSSGDKERNALDALLGLGITPYLAVDEDRLPVYPVPILNRYNQARVEAGRRFSLKPSHASTIDHGPTVSILVPVYKTPITFLERAILSVLFQSYANWELILVDDFSQRPDIDAILKSYTNVDSRVKVHFRGKNGGISAATNEALRIATGPYVGLLDHDDMLTYDALERIVERLAGDDKVDLAYSDECKIDSNDLVDELFHKPDWSPLLLLNFMYTGHFSVYRRVLVDSVGGFRSKYDFSQDYDLALRVAERQPKVLHIDEILYGWRMAAGSAAIGDKPTARISNIAALQDAAVRRGYGGVAVALPTANRIKRSVGNSRPLVSIVVPSDNLSNILETVSSIISHSTYEPFEILVVTNSKLIAAHGGSLASSTTRLIKYDRPYNFSEKCNIGASSARGEYIVFFNDDVRVISPDWIESLLEYLTLPGVGVVGPKLAYETGTIQHAGMVTGVRRLVGTAFHTYPASSAAYFNLAQSVREVSLISGACLAMPINFFHEIGGFDAHNVPIAHSDVDLCFRVRESGRTCIYTPHARLMHIGHLSLGSVEAEERRKANPFRKDKADLLMLKKWGRYLERDPYFPPKMRDLVYIDSQEPFSYKRSGIVNAAHGNDFILFSHDLSASGAPRCLYEVAKVLIEAGHYVLVVSPEDGPFRSRFNEVGADTIVDPLALDGHEAVIHLAKNFDVAICNTILSWRLPKYLAPYMPVYLYALETEYIRHMRDTVPGFLEGLSAATAIWAAGPYIVSKVSEYCGLEAQNVESCVEELPDLENDNVSEDCPETVLIALIGTYESRKGQDLAVDAFARLPSQLQSFCRLFIAGRTNDRQFRADIEKRAGNNKHIIFHNELDYSQVVKTLRRADIILVPSRDDGGPTTAIDALGAGKILIISSTSGISRYLEDGETGFVFHDNTAEDLCHALCRAFERKARWPEIGVKARKLYIENFTRQRFKERLLRALDLKKMITAPPLN